MVLERAKHPFNEMIAKVESDKTLAKGAIETTWGSRVCFTNPLELFDGFGTKCLSGR